MCFLHRMTWQRTGLRVWRVRLIDGDIAAFPIRTINTIIGPIRKFGELINGSSLTLQLN